MDGYETIMPSIDKVYKISLVRGHIILYTCVIVLEYQPSGTGGTRSPPAKATGSGNRSYIIKPSNQLLLKKFFDSIIPSMKTSKIQNGHQGAPKWPTGSGKWFRFLGAPIIFRYISFLIRALLL